MSWAHLLAVPAPGSDNSTKRCIWSNFCLDEAAVSLAADLLLPSAAIIISSLVAVFILRGQLLAQRRDRLAALIGRTTELLAEVEAEGELRRLGEPHDLDKAVRRAEAGLFALSHSLTGRDRFVPAVIRDEMFLAFLNATTPHQFLAQFQSTVTIFEGWTLGTVHRKYIIEIGRWRGGSVDNDRRGLDQVKYTLEQIHQEQGGSRTTRRTLIELLQRVPNMRRIARLARPRPVPLSERIVAWWHRRQAPRGGK